MKKKLTPEQREHFRRIEEEGKAARENMRRILDDIDARRREREERASRSFWNRLRRRLHAA